MAFFQPFHIHRPALNGVVFDDLPRPLAELHRPLVVHLEADCNNQLQIIMRQFPIDLPSALGLNYPEFPDSCLLGQFAVCIDFLICSLTVRTSTSYSAAIIFCVNQMFSSS